MLKVVVTGASTGIGYAIARRFAKEGNTVIVCSRNEAAIKKAAEKIAGETGNPKIMAARCDVSNPTDRKQLSDFVNQNGGTPDILVNNAGYFLPGQIHNEPEGTYESMMETNMAGAYHLTRLFVNDMMARKSGHIFNICSTASITAYTNGGSYCISKYALYGFSRVLREELKPYRIKVTSVLPGATLTNSWAGTELPEDRFMQPEEVADMIYAAASLSGNAVVEDILIRPLEGDI